jgi:RNA polymerase sigma-70 factor (ECF subfamily)
MGDMIEAVEDEDSQRMLLVRAASGSPDAARSLLDLTAEKVYGFIFARVGGRQEVAEDLVQSTYLEGMRSAHSFRGDATLTTWLCAIARRQVARHFESERRRLRLERRLRLVAVELEKNSEPSVVAGSDAMIAALSRMMPLHRQILVLKYLDGLSVEQIAGELGRSKIQIQSLLQRARSGLKRELEKEEPRA